MEDRKECCPAMEEILNHPIANSRGIKWQTMYNFKTGDESLALVYHCGGAYWKTPVVQLRVCPFCKAEARDIPVEKGGLKIID